jgi:Rieske Fe-S protein
MRDDNIEQDCEREMSRRRFILLVTAAAVAADARRACARGSGGQLIDAGPLSSYSKDGLYEGFRDLGFFVIHNGDKLIALSSSCTHRKCKLSVEKDRSFYCNCHGSTFDPSGRVTAGPASRDLPEWPITVEKGHLFVKVSA